MLKQLQDLLLLIGSMMYGVTWFVLLPNQASRSVVAQTVPLTQTINDQSLSSMEQSDPMSQITNVSELRDVAPTDWDYEALENLVRRYDCLAAYPNQTYRDDKSLARREFAVRLNACVNTIQRLSQENVALLREDIDRLKRLIQEFFAELVTLGAGIDKLESQVSFLENHQFSTTTTLRGEVIFGIADVFGQQARKSNILLGDNERGEPAQTIFQERIRLNLETSFTGKDLLRTRLQAGNAGGRNRLNATSPTGTNMTRLAYDNGVDNQVTLGQLFYRTSAGPVTLFVGARGVGLDTVFDPINPLLGNGATGALSRLQIQNNIVYLAPGNTGAAVTFRNDLINFTVTYLSDDSAVPREGSGLFNGDYSVGTQLSFSLKNTWQIAATYVHSSQKDSPLFGGVSSLKTEFPFGNNPTSANRFGVQANFRLSPILSFNAWGGYAKVRDENDIFDEQDVWSWNASAALVNVLFEGSLFWVGGGLPPKASSEAGTSYIIETGFRIPLSNNIAITTGGYFIFHPNHDNSNDSIFVGVIRTVFFF